MATQYTAGLVTGQVLTAATMNQIGAAWETWTPTYTNFAGTNTYARYVRINKLVIASCTVTVTTSTGAGNAIISLPITARATTSQAGREGFGMFFDASLADSYVLACLATTTTTAIFYLANNTAPAVLGAASLAVNDEISFTMIYEAA
jgi:hypothetical protein